MLFVRYFWLWLDHVYLVGYWLIHLQRNRMIDGIGYFVPLLDYGYLVD